MFLILTFVLVFFLIFQVQEVWHMALLPGNLLDILVIASLVMCLVETARGIVVWPRRLPHMWLGLGFIVAMHLPSIVYSDFGGLIRTNGVATKMLVVFMLVVLACNTSKRIWAMNLLVVGMAVMVGVHCLLQIKFGEGFGGHRPMLMRGGAEALIIRAKFVGVMDDPNDTSLFLVLSLPLLYAVFTRPSMPVRLLGFGAGLVLVLGQFTTQSRGGYVAFAAMSLMAINQFLHTRRALLASLALCIGVLFFAPQRVVQSGMLSVDRLVLWGEANQYFKQSPIVGVGVAQLQNMMSDYKTAHNSFVQSYTETGIIGYFFWFSWLLVSVYGCWIVSHLVPDDDDDRLLLRLARAMTPAIFGFCAAAYFLTRNYFLPMYVLLGLAAAIYRLAAERVGYDNLNRLCGLDNRRAWLYPALCVGSIFFIYINIRVVYLLQ